MPEAAVNENHSPVFRQHDVRSPRQLLSVQSETIPHAVQQAPNHLFGRRVFAANTRHVPGAASFGEAVFVHGGILAAADTDFTDQKQAAGTENECDCRAGQLV
jgi:hypothetical protein